MTLSRLPWDVQWRYPFSKVKQIWKISTMCCTVCMDYFPSIYIYIVINIHIYTHRKRSFPLSIPCFLFISFNCHCPTGPSVGRWHCPRESPLTRISNVIRSKRVIGITPGWGGFLWRNKERVLDQAFSGHIIRYILIPVLDIIWLIVLWLVVWTIFFDNIWESYSQLTNSYFSRLFLNHQPVMIIMSSSSNFIGVYWPWGFGIPSIYGHAAKPRTWWKVRCR